MEPTILENCIIEIKEPRQCSEIELKEFHDLVVLGKKVMIEGLLGRIKKCELLAFCYNDSMLVGISAIKHPSKNHRQEIIEQAGLDIGWEKLDFEIGYSYTSPDFRKNGISSQLKTQLLKVMEARAGTIFSTTAIKSSQVFLEQNGFQKTGHGYDGANDAGIILYIKQIQSTN